MSKPITVEYFRKFLQRLGNFIGEKSLEVDTRISILEDRIRQLESTPTLKYLGVHVPGREYSEGEFVTAAGSVWFCKRTTTTNPGSSHDWQLAVKRGDKGKDAKDLRNEQQTS